MTTHYDVLGVHRLSELASIRASYIRLMKRHHPDSLDHPARRKSALDGDVYRINLAYSVLRDPEKRAAYDAELRQQRAGQLQHQPLRPNRSLIVSVGNPSKRRVDFRWTLVPVALLVFSADQLARSWSAGDSASQPALASFSSGGFAQPAVEHAVAPIDLPGLLDVVNVAAALPLANAVAFSQRCFTQAQLERSAGAAEICIAFDHAFGYWHDGEFRGTPDETYFLLNSMNARHMSALGSLGPDQARVRIDEIRSRTFSTLVDSVNAGVKRVALNTGPIAPPDSNAGSGHEPGPTETDAATGKSETGAEAQ